MVPKASGFNQSETAYIFLKRNDGFTKTRLWKRGDRPKIKLRRLCLLNIVGEF